MLLITPSLFSDMFEWANTAPCINCIIPEKLYLGSEDARHPDVLAAHGIVRVISLQAQWQRAAHSQSIKTLPEGIREYPYYIEDHHEVDLSSIFWPAFAQIETSPGPCLVHCAAGISRSASIVIGYLMYAQDLTAVEARARVKEARPCIRPNHGFWEQLSVHLQEKLAQRAVEAALADEHVVH